MPVELFQNNATTNLSSGVTSGAASVPVLSTAAFSNATNGTSQFRIAIDQELILVNQTSSGSFDDLVRGIEGTTAATHASGAGVYEVLTAASLPRNNPQYLISGQTLFNASDSLFYPDGHILLDNSDTLYYGNGIQLSDSAGNLYYGSSTVLADANDNLYYGNASVLANAGGELLYTSGQLFVDNIGNIYAANGAVTIDLNGNVYYSASNPMFSEFAGTTSLLYPNSGVALADASQNLYYGNGVYPGLGTVLADSSANIHLPAQLFDGGSSAGSSGQFLSSTGTTVAWATITQPFPITSANLTGQNAAVTSVATVTPGSLGTYRIGAYLNVTARTLDVIQVSVTYKDETGTSQTVLLSGLVSATGVTNISPVDIRANTGQAIIVKTALTTGGGSITYDIGATIQQLN